MHLKKLILSGFKSFADRIVFNFEEGITGVVGPNGSGKSNVIDAVRWVMGEQNAKQLRGEKATDIIFSGSDKRKQLGMAEVTLVIDNSQLSDFCPPEYRHDSEISLTRRLYIDGQREYLINRKACRFKDLISFFATTGLAGRSYSMIQQGQVDRILNAKPEDVREILEEAAGTLIFRNRRAGAQKKLTTTHENLSRIDDIVAEISSQLESLQSQVKKAEKWQSLTGKLKEEEISLFATNYHQASHELASVQKGIDNDVDEEAKIMARLAKLDALHEQLNQSLNESDPELENIREKVTLLREKIARNESAITAPIALLEKSHQQKDLLANEIEEQQEELKKLDLHLESSLTDLNKMEQQNIEIADQIESITFDLETLDESAQVFDSRKEEITDEILNLSRLLESNSLRCEAIQRDRSQLSRELVACSERIEAIKTDRSNLSEKLEAAKEQADIYQSGLDADITAKQELEKTITLHQAQLTKYIESRDHFKSTYLEAKASLASYESTKSQFSPISQIYNDLKEKVPDFELVVLGVLADFVVFKENIRQLPTNTLAALELWVEKLVIPSHELLDQYNRWSHQHQLGRASVIPIKPFFENAFDSTAFQQWQNKFDAIPLLEFLEIKSHKEIVSAIFSRVFHLPLISLSDEDCKEIPSGCVVITAGGIIISSNYDVNIGHSSQEGLLSRKEKADRNAANLKEAEIQLAKYQNKIDSLLETINREKMAITEIDEKMSTQNQEVIDIFASVQSLSQQIQYKIELSTETTEKEQKLKAQDRELINDLEKMGESRIALAQDHETLKSELSDLEDEFSQIDEKRDEVRKSLHTRETEKSAIDSKIAVIRERMLILQGQLEKVQQGLTRKYQENQKIEEEVIQAEVEKNRLTEEIKQCIIEREGVETIYAEKQEKNAQSLKEIRLIEDELKKSRDKQIEFHKTMSTRDLKKAKYSELMKTIREQAQEKYGIHIADDKFKPVRSVRADDISKSIRSLKSQIDQLGAINMVAIEEYRKLSDRFQFIESQRQEILASIRLLEATITDIEEVSKEKFLKSFSTVDANFRELFPILFPDGEARLHLTDESNPLETGVDIIVRMPGKKQQSMSLYSGGEKALTAISLIFALLKTKPTPFCFLDEVDAPLDEGNVGRYNRVLESLSSQFQFIVITHNRRTMEVLDQLYGVTMQEGGVSTVVGVDMKKDIPSHLKKAVQKTTQRDREVQGATAQ